MFFRCGVDVAAAAAAAHQSLHSEGYLYIYRLIFICWNLILILFGDYLLDQHIWCYILLITGWILTNLVYLYFWWNTIWYLFAAADYFLEFQNIFWKFIFAAD